MIGRRPFMIGCGGVAATPAFAHLAQPMTATLAPLPAAPLPAVMALADPADPGSLALRIHGWESPDDPSPAAHGEVWVQINASWRAAWR